MNETPPVGLAANGRDLWTAIVSEHDLDAPQLAQLTEACRAKDRLDVLDEVLRGDAETWMRLVKARGAEDEQTLELRITGPLMKANETANVMKQLLAALRLPDAASGKKPQYRGPRGAQVPSQPGGSTKVSSLDRARAAKSS